MSTLFRVIHGEGRDAAHATIQYASAVPLQAFGVEDGEIGAARAMREEISRVNAAPSTRARLMRTFTPYGRRACDGARRGVTAGPYAIMPAASVARGDARRTKEISAGNEMPRVAALRRGVAVSVTAPRLAGREEQQAEAFGRERSGTSERDCGRRCYSPDAGVE